MRKLCLVVVVVVAGCKERVHVNVDCKTTADNTIECSLTQDKGTTEVETCWDVSVPCKNATVVTAPHQCSKVKDGATIKVTIAKDKLANIDKCDGGTAMKLENLTIDGQTGD